MSIHRRENRSGSVRYDVRLRRPDGSQYGRSFRTKKEAKEFEASEIAAHSRGTWLDPKAGRITFADWSDEWYQSAQQRWRPRTIEKHRLALEVHWRPRLGRLAIAKIVPRHVQAAVNSLASTHKPASVRTYYGTLRACMADAVELDLIGRSPCRAIKLPRLDHVERRTVTPTELHALADAVGPNWRALVYLGGVAGLRFGEAIGLRVLDVDLREGSVRVARTVVEQNGRLEIGEPKTKAAVRTLALPPELVDEVRQHVELMAIEGEELLFADAFGGPLRRSNFRRRVFDPAVRLLGLDGLTFHGLRHSAATHWVANGLDPRTVQHRLGHADPRLVLQLYAHAVSSADRGAAEASSSIFWSK